MFISMPKSGALPLLALLAGCSQLPIDGPAARDIDRSAVSGLQNERGTVVYDYVLLDISRVVLDTLQNQMHESMYGTFGAVAAGVPLAKVGAGDVLQVSVFESAAGGLFVSADAGGRTGNFVSIPNVTVNREGNISVPYAGSVHAAGHTVTEVERDIEKKLSGRAIEPQVSINFVEQNASMVSVVGDALGGANKFKISGSGDRILDVVAKTGGLRYPGHEVYLTLQRQGRKATVHFPRLVNFPNENIYVLPGDVIYAFREQQKYVAIGAFGTSTQTSGVTGQFTFDQEHLSLNEAIAKAGGLQDSRADPAQVFVYRVEARETLERMGVDLSRFAPEQRVIPTVYRANFRDPSSPFAAQNFMVRNKDVIYATNADAVEFVKFLTYASTVTSTVAGVTQNVVLTEDLVRGGVLVGK
jgi:polysaccharide biosynthesis/export protein